MSGGSILLPLESCCAFISDDVNSLSARGLANDVTDFTNLKSNTLALIAPIASRTRTKPNVIRTHYIFDATPGAVHPSLASKRRIMHRHQATTQTSVDTVVTSSLIHPNGMSEQNTSTMFTNSENATKPRSSSGRTTSDNISSTHMLAPAGSGPTSLRLPA